jgi:hypothetical protein
VAIAYVRLPAPSQSRLTGSAVWNAVLPETSSHEGGPGPTVTVTVATFDAPPAFVAV